MANYYTKEQNKKWRESLPKKIVSVKLVIRSKNGLILLVKPIYKPTWQFPGGGVDADEDPKVAALRELKEETGIQGDVAKLRLLDVIFKSSDDMLFIMFEYTDLFAEDKKLVPEDKEIEEYKFVLPSDVQALLPDYYADFCAKYV